LRVFGSARVPARQVNVRRWTRVIESGSTASIPAFAAAVIDGHGCDPPPLLHVIPRKRP